MTDKERLEMAISTLKEIVHLGVKGLDFACAVLANETLQKLAEEKEDPNEAKKNGNQ